MSAPTIASIVAECLEDLEDLDPTLDLDEVIDDIVADNIPVMVSDLFAMVVVDNTLSGVSAPGHTPTADFVLRAGITRRVEDALRHEVSRRKNSTDVVLDGDYCPMCDGVGSDPGDPEATCPTCCGAGVVQ